MRITGTRARRRVLILCEDEKSSRFYFEGFHIDPRRVEVACIGTGRNTHSLVEDAIRRKKEGLRLGMPFNEIWCVMDRDSFPARNFNEAFRLAEANHINVAWANEAFELWYVLHFNLRITGMSRKEYKPSLDALLKCEYDKADDQIYRKLEARQSEAIKNAKRLQKHWIALGGCNPERDNPSTNVHELVEFLKELQSLGSAEVE